MKYNCFILHDHVELTKSYGLCNHKGRHKGGKQCM